MRNLWCKDSFTIALRNRVGIYRFLPIYVKCKSDGQKVEAVARVLNITLEKLVAQLATEIGFSYLATVPPILLSLLPRGISLTALRRAEIIPLLTADIISGFAAVNPARIQEYFPELSQLTVFVSTPAAISQALSLSEHLLLEQAQTKSLERQDLIIGVIFRMMDYSHTLGEQNFYITEVDDQLCYEVRGVEVPIKRGVIAREISAEVLALCAEQSSQRKFLGIVGGESSLMITLADDASEYCLRKIELISENRVAEKREVVFTERAVLVKECSTVMLIDDNRDFLRVLERFITRAGFKVICLSSASHAMRHIEFTKEWPQAIVTDLHMPEMSGLDLVEELGRRYNVELPPILFLTSDESIESEISALKRGAICFVAKSRDPRLLVAHLERVCGVARSQEAA